jgi:hypothetical protein
MRSHPYRVRARAQFRAHPDKIAASKRKWLRVGGPPLGYELKDGKLVVIEREAERVHVDAS